MELHITKNANVKTSIPGPKSKELLERWHKVEAETVGYQAQIVCDHAKGAIIYDVDENSFIDWTSGVLVTNVGHSHPRLVNAVRQAAEKVLNSYEYPTEYRVVAAEKLIEAAPQHLDKCFFLSTGSEATETAMRIMKRKTGCYEIIGFHGGYHGRTCAAASAGGMSKPKKRFGPSMPGIIRAPFPYCYRCPFKSKPGSCGLMCLEFLDDEVRANSSGSLAGVIVEPYLGTAGFIFPPDGWITMLEKWIREQKILYTLDEVQSAFGRTGKMWAMEWESITPDVVALGKGIGSGVTTSAILVRGDVVKVLGAGEMSSTNGGNSLSCSAVIAVLEIIKEENLIDNAAMVGTMMKKRLLEIKNKACHLGDVRGKGLVMGLEIVEDKDSKEPSSKLAKEIIDKCALNGLLVGAVGLYGNVIRVAPPLVITEAQAAESLDIMERVLTSL